MTLKISKIRYTSRNGFTVDFERPGEVRLTHEQAYILYLGLQADLTQADLDEHFTETEQQTIIQYHELTLEKMQNPDAKKVERAKAGGIQQALVRCVERWLTDAPQEIQTMVEKFMGWRFPADYVSCHDKFLDDLGLG